MEVSSLHSTYSLYIVECLIVYTVLALPVYSVAHLGGDILFIRSIQGLFIVESPLFEHS